MTIKFVSKLLSEKKNIIMIEKNYLFSALEVQKMKIKNRSIIILKNNSFQVFFLNNSKLKAD